MINTTRPTRPALDKITRITPIPYYLSMTDFLWPGGT
jgi:hypothetical protein